MAARRCCPGTQQTVLLFGVNEQYAAAGGAQRPGTRRARGDDPSPCAGDRFQDALRADRLMR